MGQIRKETGRKTTLDGNGNGIITCFNSTAASNKYSRTSNELVSMSNNLTKKMSKRQICNSNDDLRQSSLPPPPSKRPPQRSPSPASMEVHAVPRRSVCEITSIQRGTSEVAVLGVVGNSIL